MMESMEMVWSMSAEEAEEGTPNKNKTFMDTFLSSRSKWRGLSSTTQLKRL